MTTHLPREESAAAHRRSGGRCPTRQSVRLRVVTGTHVRPGLDPAHRPGRSMAPDCRATSARSGTRSASVCCVCRSGWLVRVRSRVGFAILATMASWGGGLLVRWRHHSTGHRTRAPRSPRPGQIVARDMAVEIRRGELDRTPGQQRLLAAAAISRRRPGVRATRGLSCRSGGRPPAVARSRPCPSASGDQRRPSAVSG